MNTGIHFGVLISTTFNDIFASRCVRLLDLTSMLPFIRKQPSAQYNKRNHAADVMETYE